MLPISFPLRRRAIAAAAALSLALPAAAPAMADSRDTRNFLKGVAAAVIVGALIKEAGKAQARERDPYNHGYGGGYGHGYGYGHDPRPAPVYTPPAPVYHSAVAQAFAEYSPASKRAIQARLRAYGYYRGAIDGVYGAGTRAAIEAYARDTGNSGALRSRDGTVTLLNGLLV